MKYHKIDLSNEHYIITNLEDWQSPKKAVTFAFDTETLLYYKGQILSDKELVKTLKGISICDIKKDVTSRVWAWLIYDEFNGFFMTTSFKHFLKYICLAGYKYGWCHNAKFDFAQIDYKILAEQKEIWKKHDNNKASKGQAFTYSSLHNDMGARYGYKLWIPYKRSGKNKDRHLYVHSVEFRDFFNIFHASLKKILNELKVTDNNGNDIRKLDMDYQNVNINNLSQNDIQYCENDVKGLYFAIKKFNESITEQSNGECSIFGKETNLMTAGGFAKRELLRSLYPNEKGYKERIKKFKKDHPLRVVDDKYFRQHGLYRGGICIVNEKYKGKLIQAKMNRYDVNSEYPFAMSIMPDLKGNYKVTPYKDYLKMQDKNKYECIMVLESVSGIVKKGFVGFWFDIFQKKYVDEINETGTHLIFERELNELEKWYDDFEYKCEKVILYKKGKCNFKKFVEENYKIKALAGVQNNPALKNNAKLKLNSSYGKLGERITRRIGHYELNEETGAIHFVADGEEEDDSGQMNIVLASLVTAIARVWIMSHIRELHGDKMQDEFIYIDTDSIHTLAELKKPDNYTLGGFKLETTCEAFKYIAPKTYIDIEKIENGIVTKFEPHTKGVNVASIIKDFESQEKLTLEYIDKRFNYGEKFNCLASLNVVGGKALVPIEKYLARYELAPVNLTLTSFNGSEILNEI